MPDLEHLLRSSLEEVGEAYEPSDTAAARARFEQHAKRRKVRLVLSGVAVTAAAVAAAVFVYSVPASEETDEPSLLPAAVQMPEPVATIAVGFDPVSMASDGIDLWFVGADGLGRIDTIMDELLAVENLEGEGDEMVIGAGSAWVADTDGFVARYDALGEGMMRVGDRFRVASGTDKHLDMAIGPGGLLAVDPDRGVLITVDLSGTDGPSLIPDGYPVSEDEIADISPTDISVFNDKVWVLDGEAGLLQIHGSGSTYEVPSGRNADLLATDHLIWVGGGTSGILSAVDPDTGDMVEHDVGGAHTDLAWGGVFVWALTGAPDEPSVLRQFDAGTGEQVGEPLTLDESATDVAYSSGSVWVTTTGGDVIRIRPATR